MDSGASERIHSEADLRVTDEIHVEHAAEIGNVSIEIVMPLGCRGTERGFVGNPLYTFEPTSKELICLALNPAGNAGPRGSTVRWVIFEAAVSRRVVRGSNNDPISQSSLSPAVVGKDGMRNSRRGSVFLICCQHDFNAISSEHFERGRLSGNGKSVCVHPQEQRAVNSFLFAIEAYRLTDRQDMMLVEAPLE